MTKMIGEMIAGLQHVGIPTNDLDETVSFYEQFGFKNVYQTVNTEADERVAFLQLGNLMIETYETKRAVLREGAWDHIALDVTDIESVFRLVKEKGLPMVDEGVRFLPFWEHGVKFFTILGPNKEKVEFCQKL